MKNGRGHEDERTITNVDVGKEIGRFFVDPASAPTTRPVFVLITGGSGSGKTTIRKQKFSDGYVVLDANEIYRNLRKGSSAAFEELAPVIDVIGQGIARRAVREKRNIVMEVIGESYDEISAILEAGKSAGYEPAITFVDCEPSEAYMRHLKAVGGR